MTIRGGSNSSSSGNKLTHGFHSPQPYGLAPTAPSTASKVETRAQPEAVDRLDSAGHQGSPGKGEESSNKSSKDKGKQPEYRQFAMTNAPSTSQTRLPPPTPAQTKGLKHLFRQLDEQKKAKAARQERRNSRIQTGLPEGNQAIISNEKLDAYAQNASHPRGGDKAAHIHNKTDLTLNKHYDVNNAQLAFDSTIRTPGYWAARESVKRQIRDDLAKPVPAEAKVSNHHGGRFDTKHRISGPKGAVTMRAQWYYKADDETGIKSKNPSLVTLQPSDTSSDEEGPKK